jgi:hypothetical protein
MLLVCSLVSVSLTLYGMDYILLGSAKELALKTVLAHKLITKLRNVAIPSVSKNCTMGHIVFSSQINKIKSHVPF